MLDYSRVGLTNMALSAVFVARPSAVLGHAALYVHLTGGDDSRLPSGDTRHLPGEGMLPFRPVPGKLPFGPFGSASRT
ncbi:hypothetical protein PGTUg99_012720 [Puccinia graminis f. sp. tritici]|uniref:Uncharacterized protein n=1 Tax=Puccinia graminis f. sp. tritici TaxID=56615 RepID=A0A5B0R6D6_PUCGR|nr:hypothetical protein PGTUg99_012720 [Puccinia graminis f. sp. tritici]